jgi:hypothetical protein
LKLVDSNHNIFLLHAIGNDRLPFPNYLGSELLDLVILECGEMTILPPTSVNLRKD